MGNRSDYQFKVGLFVSFGLGLVLLSLYLLGGSQMTLSKVAHLHTKLENAQGLYRGSVVSFSGLTIGNISSVEFIPAENLLNVVLDVDSNFLKKIVVGSTIEVRTQGALGDKFLYISPGKPGNKSLEDGDQIEAAKSVDLIGAMSERSGEALKIFDVIGEAHKVLKAMNDNNRTERIFSNLAETSEQLSRFSKESKEIITELRSHSSPKFNSAIEKLDRILGKIDSGEGTLGALINDPSIHDQIKSMVGGSSKKKYMKNLLRNAVEKGQSE